MDFTILHFAIHIVWRANVICTYRKSGIARKTTVAYPELRLIGWQIYTFIDINKKSKELEEAKTAALISTERNNALTTNAISDFYYYILLKSDPLGVEYRFLDYRISSLYHFSNIGEIETCNTIVKVLLEMIVVPEDIKVLESGKNRILMLLTKVKDTDKIIGYEELVSRIARLGIMPKQSK